jgi:hypothetical protein
MKSPMALLVETATMAWEERRRGRGRYARSRDAAAGLGRTLRGRTREGERCKLKRRRSVLLRDCSRAICRGGGRQEGVRRSLCTLVRSRRRKRTRTTRGEAAEAGPIDFISFSCTPSRLLRVSFSCLLSDSRSADVVPNGKVPNLLLPSSDSEQKAFPSDKHRETKKRAVRRWRRCTRLQSKSTRRRCAELKD